MRWSIEYLHGRRQSIRLCSWPLATAVSVLGKYATGSTALSLHVSMNEAMVAQFSAPASCPANSEFLRLSAIGRMVLSTLSLSISRRPSAGKMQRPSQYLAI